MTFGQFVLNLLFAALAFFIARWLLTLITPDSPTRPSDREKAITIGSLIVAVVIFFLNFAASIIVRAH